ncbi:complement C4 [Chanos chanos]|uniref:Complement C4 n=1 Tax=Chanos chanos TaxID=29144 RepID=A0A6J2W553_CHACN|nr:complement C4-like [Chanos chanos]
MGTWIYLMACLASAVHFCVCTPHRFLVTAPSVFHVGVKERVSVQVGKSLLNQQVTCYLEQEKGRIPMSHKQSQTIRAEGHIETLELEVFADKVSNLKSGTPPYLNLVCDISSQRRIARVLVSQHSGYIFIQTSQPVYNPTQTVWYRIFTLDHSMRPKSGSVQLAVINAEGNKIKKLTVHVTRGIYSNSFHIPDVSKPGVWKIIANYKGDDSNVTIREFKVQKFVLPSFIVSIQPDIHYYLLSAETFSFTISASYSYGEAVSGGFHCRFGVKKEPEENSQPVQFIKNLEQTGTIKEPARVSIRTADLRKLLKDDTLEGLAETRAQFYIGVTVTDTRSGEVQEGEIMLPIVLQAYSVDLSRTRSHFIPGVPLDVTVVVHLANGHPAAHKQVQIDVSSSIERTADRETDQEGTVHHSFNIDGRPTLINVKVTIEGKEYSKTLLPATSPSQSFLFISVSNNVLSPGQNIPVSFNIPSGRPEDGRIYYMVLSRGVLRKWDSIKTGVLTKTTVSISPDMTPSFRLIGYYYHQNGEIVADSVWVDVQDVCEGTIKIKPEKNTYKPSELVKMDIDLGDQKAKVALLAVDKAIYALNAHNKLTPKQVFASMQSYDLGCSYGGGQNSEAVFNDAGLTFISHSETKSQMRKGFSCESGFRRQRRSIDLQSLMGQKESTYTDPKLQKCCHHGFTLIPMALTCQQRAARANRTEGEDCANAFLDCCLHAAKLREKKRLEDQSKSHGRTSGASDIEDFFDNSVQDIRRYFPPSFEFRDIEVNGKQTHSFHAPDSITTWEIQAVSLSTSHGICVAEPADVRVFKNIFVSLRLPYSVRRHEQMSIVAVIYNYGNGEKELAVHMKQVDNLCSPGSTTSSSYINITLAAQSSQTVTFSAVPMATGEIPITIQLYDRDFETGLDAIVKMLLVKTEGVEKREEKSYFFNLDGRSENRIEIDGEFPNNTVPDSPTNLFVKLEGEVFGQSAALSLLSPSSVEKLITLPNGCGEQTMLGLSPTALSIRYLDKSNRWAELTPGLRDKALDFITIGYDRILTYKKADGSYGAFPSRPSSNWLTALVVKVLALVAERQVEETRQGGRSEKLISEEDIRISVRFLIGQQNNDGSFSDPNPVLDRKMQGGIGGVENDASLTAFITIALHHSRPFLEDEQDDVESSISKATGYLQSRVEALQRPYAVAITAYALAISLRDKSLAEPAWRKLKTLAQREKECIVWRSDEAIRLDGEKKPHKVPPANALSVETTAYGLLTALAHKDFEMADAAACFLSTQENYGGGFYSTQDTMIALEAMSQYAISQPETRSSTLDAQFDVPGKAQKEKLVLDKTGEKVEAELKRLLGNNINMKISGQGKAKMKVVKAFYSLEPEANCDDLSINVTVEGKVAYTERVIENYNYYYEEEGDVEEQRREEEDLPRSAIEWFDARTRTRRDTSQSLESQDTVKYHVCVSHKPGQGISGMAIADITLLSGFTANTEQLEKLKSLSDRYISHYEVSHGRVLLYFNEMEQEGECIAFEATQKIPIGLLQPAPATFYDYYEPDRRCSVFYSAPKRSKMVSTLCSGDVCQCAERPCHKEKETLEMKILKDTRLAYACYQPTVEYAFVVYVDSVTVKSNFELYRTVVKVVAKATGDRDVQTDSIRVFAKRRQCKGELEVGKTYLIMGKDGATTDATGQMQYLLDANTWVEKKLDPSTCTASVNKKFCKHFKDFTTHLQLDGCNV